MEDIKFCYNCGEKEKLKNIETIDNSTLENLGTEEFQDIYKIHDYIDIFKCINCSDITIYRSEWIDGEERHEEDYYNKSHVELFGTVIYPNIEHTNRHHIPTKIYKSFLSAIKVKNIDRALSLIGLRRALEMICKDKGYEDGFLGKKLSNMASDGVIPPIIDNLAGFLKDEGNKAAHGDDVEFSLDIVNNLIEFTTVIMNYIYVLPAKISTAQKNIEKSLL